MNEYELTATILATFKIYATSLQQAKNVLSNAIEGHTANFGALPSGEPLIAESVAIEGEIDSEDE